MKKPRRGPSGFTLIELMVVVTIIIILASIVFVFAQRGLEKAKLAGSIAKAKQLGVMVTIYAGDNNGELPVWHDYNRGMYWWQLISEDAVTENREEYLEKIFKSPNHREFDPIGIAQTISYGWNYPVIGRHKGDSSFRGDHVLRLNRFGAPSRVMVFCDGARTNSWGYVDPYNNVPDPDRYDGKAAAYFLDGGVRVLDTPAEFGEDSKLFVPIKQLLPR